MAGRKKIAVIGSINMDLVARTERLPGKGETVAASGFHCVPGGKGANQAVAIARLGGDVAMFGCVGSDAFADGLISNLAQNGVDTSCIGRRSGPSGMAMITVAERDNCIVGIPGANQQVTPEYLEQMRSAILSAEIFLLQNEIPLETVAYAIDLGYRAGKTLIYNPAPAGPLPSGALDKVSYLTPNEHEAKLLFPGYENNEERLAACAGRLVITLGERGAVSWDNGRVLHIPARPADVVDTTGAGDTFNGAFAWALAAGYRPEKALYFANVAASFSTERIGAQGGMPALGPVEAYLAEHRGI